MNDVIEVEYIVETDENSRLARLREQAAIASREFVRLFQTTMEVMVLLAAIALPWLWRGMTVVVDVMGIVRAFPAMYHTVLGDTLMRQPGVEVPAYLRTAVWWGIPFLIWLNVAMAIAAHLTDPRHQIRRAQRDVEDAIEAAVAEKLRENAANIASAVAPDVAAHRAEEVQRRILTTVGLRSPNGRKATTFASEVREVRADPSPNGH